MNTKGKGKASLAIMLALVLMLSPTALAFSDIAGNSAERQILELRERGIVSGVGNDLFNPQGELSFAQAVHLVIQGIGLAADTVKDASQTFVNVADEAWYADSFAAAAYHELPVASDVHPEAVITREQFAHLLFEAFILTGDYAFTEQYIMLADEDKVHQDYMNSIQKLIISHIIELDESSSFRPQEALTREEAAKWIHRTIGVIEMTNENSEEPQGPEAPDVQLKTEEVAEGINKVTLVWPEAPHPGYGLAITAINYSPSTMEAVLIYEIVLPNPDMMYPQVITEVTTSTYVDSSYSVSANLVDSSQSTTPSTDKNLDQPISEQQVTRPVE